MFSVNFSIFAADICQKGGDFLGFVPWYHYLPSGDFDGCEFKKFNLLPSAHQASDIPLILLAIVDDLLRLAGLVAIGFVIYGAIKYTASQGNPEDASSAQSTIINALVGLAIASVAVGIVAFIGSKLGS